jgi:hypothetical protein
MHAQARKKTTPIVKAMKNIALLLLACVTVVVG